jgi:hypothetical protein
VDHLAVMVACGDPPLGVVAVSGESSGSVRGSGAAAAEVPGVIDESCEGIEVDHEIYDTSVGWVLRAVVVDTVHWAVVLDARCRLPLGECEREPDLGARCCTSFAVGAILGRGAVPVHSSDVAIPLGTEVGHHTVVRPQHDDLIVW